MKKAATIRQVAERAGVAPQTVSNILNGLKQPRPDTLRRVEEAIQTLGYKPNAMARALRSQKSGVIGLLLEDPDRIAVHDPLHAEFLTGVCTTAARNGYAVSLDFPDPEVSEAKAQSLFEERRIDALILSLGELPAERRARVEALGRFGMPIILLQQFVKIPNCHFVTADDHAGAQRAVRYLAELGHRRIACLGVRPLWPGPKQRLLGFRRAAQSASIEASECMCNGNTIEAARSAISSLLASPRRPTAVLALNDLVALGVMQEAQSLGLATPRDLSVIGFNDFVFSTWVSPPISTVRIPVQQMGEAAVQIATTLLSGKRLEEPGRFEATLVPRGTTAAAPE